MSKYKKGHKGGPGRRRIISPEVQKAMEANRNAVKVLIMTELEPMIEEWLIAIITKGIKEGDINTFKTLLEISMGRLIEDPPEFLVNDEEKILVLEFRRRQEKRSLSGNE